MMLSYRKIDGQVVMLGKIENSALSFVELPDDPRMTSEHTMKVRDGAVEYEKAWWVAEKEKEEELKQDFAKDLITLEKAKTVEELKPLILKMLKII